MATNTFTMEQVCSILKWTRRQVMHRIAKGELPIPRKKGRDFEISTDWIEAALRLQQIELTKEKIFDQLKKRAEDIRKGIDDGSST